MPEVKIIALVTRDACHGTFLLSMPALIRSPEVTLSSWVAEVMKIINALYHYD
ncbi:MAG: hypothetical protein ACJAW7_001791 [Candidatus Azotimanducaceae bacterium]|jgi:hypothetical protein